MMPVIRIPDLVYERLQKHATPFVDTPATVIERLLDAFENMPAQGGLTPKLLPAGRDLLLTSEEDEQDSDNPRVASRSGFWFVNVGEGPSRDWDDCVKYGFLAAGWDPVYSKPLRRLSVGSKVFAYMKGLGYVGYGEVVHEACPVEEFTPIGYDKPLLDLPLVAEDMGHSRGDAEECEWVVGVRWHTTFPRDEAKRFTGIFANQNIVCRLRDQRTLTFLRREFNVQQTEVQ